MLLRLWGSWLDALGSWRLSEAMPTIAGRSEGRGSDGRFQYRRYLLVVAALSRGFRRGEGGVDPAIALRAEWVGEVKLSGRKSTENRLKLC